MGNVKFGTTGNATRWGIGGVTCSWPNEGGLEEDQKESDRGMGNGDDSISVTWWSGTSWGLREKTGTLPPIVW